MKSTSVSRSKSNHRTGAVRSRQDHRRKLWRRRFVAPWFFALCLHPVPPPMQPRPAVTFALNAKQPFIEPLPSQWGQTLNCMAGRAPAWSLADTPLVRWFWFHPLTVKAVGNVLKPLVANAARREEKATPKMISANSLWIATLFHCCGKIVLGRCGSSVLVLVYQGQEFSRKGFRAGAGAGELFRNGAEG